MKRPATLAACFVAVGAGGVMLGQGQLLAAGWAFIAALWAGDAFIEAQP